MGRLPGYGIARLIERAVAGRSSRQRPPLPSDLVRREDLPPQPRYLPRAVSPEKDQPLQQELRRTDDLAVGVWQQQALRIRQIGGRSGGAQGDALLRTARVIIGGKQAIVVQLPRAGVQ